MKMGRTRFSIVAEWPNGDRLVIESRKDKPLTIPGLVDCLRRYANQIEHSDRIVVADVQAAGALTEPAPDGQTHSGQD